MNKILKINITVLLAVVVFLAVFGVIKKQTYTDLFAAKETLLEDGVFDDFGVGLVSKNITKNIIELWRKELDEQSIIVQLEITSEPEFSPCAYGYCARVKHVFKGGISVGSEIFLTFEGWLPFLKAKELMLPVEYAINISFHDFLKKNHEYLVFIDRKLETPFRDNIYTGKGYSIAPVFDYGETSSIPGKTISDTSSTVLYRDIKGSEFLTDSEEAIEMLYDFKKYLVEKYPAK